MKLIVGLGNPGDKFQYTRHNIGFMVVEKLAKELLSVGRSEKAWRGEEKFSALVCKINDNLLIKPQTHMNGSGGAVLSLFNYYKVESGNICVVHDDIDLPLGKMRIRKGGGSAGHNGIESIINNLHDPNFVRFRLGIGRGKLNLHKTAGQNLHRREVEKYVLSPFRENEGGAVKHLIKNAVEALRIALDKGIEVAMNRFN
ncbi:aminoacyl-tRNA hydrolase [Candidatus Gottesmanbacteria bacterium]|nr:aminoacyl-tRNA hydrolase [Candidatus Gottesmanbacteria bacterium]MBI5452061.1 aminoacyl-tRNA hydrolase [Candidatus Gottesmanbacteria bacterium]